MFARYLMIGLAAASIVLLFFGFTNDMLYAKIAIPFVILLAVTYILSPQINWWFYQRNPIKLDKRIVFMLKQQHSFYRQLNTGDQQKFEHRLSLAMMGLDFMPMVMEEIPEDLKAVLVANLVQLTFGQEEFMLQEKFEKIIIYPSAFPSPQFPKQFHTSEIYEEDGVMMFSAPHLLKGFAQPDLYYNSGMHECAQAFLRAYPNKDYPRLSDTIWEDLEVISRFSQAKIQEWIGLEEVDVMPVAITHFMLFPVAFAQQQPKLFKQFRAIFAH
ncbi:MAG: zinc-dependent peptidase [Bacteroidota bacterium]